MCGHYVPSTEFSLLQTAYLCDTCLHFVWRFDDQLSEAIIEALHKVGNTMLTHMLVRTVLFMVLQAVLAFKSAKNLLRRPMRLRGLERKDLQPFAKFAGHVTLPGSKSLSNRAIILAALCDERTALENVLDSEDVNHLRHAMVKLNVDIRNGSATALTVVGSSRFMDNKDERLFLGNAGTAMRPLTAVLAAGRNSTFTLDGTKRMRERPIKDLVDSLQQLGANIECTSTHCPPVHIHAGQGIQGGSVEVSGNVSSQYLTALLMAAPLANRLVTITVKNGPLNSAPYVRMTIHMMRMFGIEVEADEDMSVFRVSPGQYKSPGHYFVEGDASSASYFLAGAAIMGGPVTVTGCGAQSIQGDVRFAHLLRRMGATVSVDANSITVSRDTSCDSQGRPVAPLMGIDEDCGDIPDVAMTLAMVGLFAQGRTVIRNVYSWRVKETERMVAMVTELRKLGATVEEGPDYLVVEGIQSSGQCLRSGVEIETYDDHRMAMCFALVACGGVSVTIRDPGCTAKTFPAYFELLGHVVDRDL